MNKFRKIFDHKWWLYDFIKWTGFPAIGLWFRFKRIYASGKKPKKTFKGKFIICSNHVAYEDAAALVTGIWERRIGFLATREMVENKRFKWFFKGIGCIPVDKSNFDIDSIKQAINTLKRGHSLGIFPEGQISKDGNILPFKSGTVMAAWLAGADILPIYISKRKNKLQRWVMVVGDKIKLKNYMGPECPTIGKIDEVTEILNQKEQELKKIYEDRWLNRKKKH